MSDAARILIRRDFDRPEPDVVARLAAAPTGYVVDAMGRRGAMGPGIDPLLPPGRFAGPALTVATVARDNLVPYAALREARPGDVLVIATGDHEECAVVGDLFIGMAKNAGIVAVITDGRVRDIEGIEAVGIPVYARGLTPNSPEKAGPGEIGVPVTVGGRIVAPGDVIVGDRDGVVVVPGARAAEVAAAIAGVRAKEAKVEAAVAGGLAAPDWLDEALARLGARVVE